MWPNPHFSADLVTFTEEILNRKLHFCAVLHPYVSQADGFDILVDLPGYENPSNLFHAAVQPDLVLKRNHHIIVIELRCCFKTNLLHSRNFKIEKYKTFKRHSNSYSQQNWNIFFQNAMTQLYCKNIFESNINCSWVKQNMSETVIGCLHYIYTRRNKEWNNPQLMKFTW